MLRVLILSSAFVLVSFNLFGQFESNYEPILYTGTIPDHFLHSAKEKITSHLEQKDDILSKKEGEEFYTSTNFELSKILLSGEIYFNDKLTKYVNSIIDNLLKEQPELRKQITGCVTKFTAVNAAAWGEGTLFINLGLIARVENEAQLAYILSHEIAHYIKKHNLEQFKNDKEVEKSIFNKANEMEQLFAKLSFSRENEYEADKYGLEIYLKSNYDPKEAANALRLLKKSDEPDQTHQLDLRKIFETKTFTIEDAMLYTEKTIEKEKKDQEDFLVIEVKVKPENIDEAEKLSTHPNIDKRIEAIEFATKKVGKSKTKNIQGAQLFKEIQKTATFEIIEKQFNIGAYSRCLYNALLLLEVFPKNKYLVGVVSRSLYWIAYYQSINSLRLVMPNHYRSDDPAYKSLLYFLNKLDNKQMLQLCYSYSKSKPNGKENEALVITIPRVLDMLNENEKAKKYYKLYQTNFPEGNYIEFAKYKLGE